jgi:hypothetical protein
MKKTKSRSIESTFDLARLVGRERSTVTRWLQRDDWPFPKRPPWQRSLVPKIMRWIADTLIVRESSGVQGNEELTALKKQKLEEEIRKLSTQADASEAALARERGTLMDADDVEAEWANVCAMIRRGFQNLASQLVPLALTHGMPHEAAPEFQQQAEAIVAAILQVMSPGYGKTKKEPSG